MFRIKKNELGKWYKKENPELKGCNCPDCGKFIDFKEPIWIHKDIKGLVLCENCKTPERKFNNNPKEYNGVTYQSTLEAKYAAELDLKVKAGLIKSWKRQVKIPINVKFMKDDLPVLTDEPELSLKRKGIKFYHLTNYWMDFVITHNDNSQEYIETKGAETSTWKIKFLMAQAILKNRIEITLFKEKTYFRIKKKEKKNGN